MPGPLTTNTQPDFNRVGNFELLERTVRSHNWLRTDTIFIENEQIVRSTVRELLLDDVIGTKRSRVGEELAVG